MEQDCRIFQDIYREMGGTETIPTNCCTFSINRIQCNNDSRIQGITVNDMNGYRIPPSLSLLPFLQVFNGSNSQLKGTIPAALGNLTFYAFNVRRNQLQGEIQHIRIRTDVPSFADFRENQFHGFVPQDLILSRPQGIRPDADQSYCPFDRNLCVAPDRFVAFCNQTFTCTKPWETETSEPDVGIFGERMEQQPNTVWTSLFSVPVAITFSSVLFVLLCMGGVLWYKRNKKE
jgi:hypothetical protein